jgi:hypothetical protein
MTTASRSGPRVGLFVTCLVDLYRPTVGFAAVKLLELDENDIERHKAATSARAKIGKGGVFLGAQSVQMHGGVGRPMN